MEQLIRIDVLWVRDDNRKALYVVPVDHVFVVSAINTTSANTLKLRINDVFLGEASPDWATKEFFRRLVLNAWDVVQVSHAFSWALEDISMSGSLIPQT